MVVLVVFAARAAARDEEIDALAAAREEESERLAAARDEDVA